MTTKIHRITDRQPEFPCWMWHRPLVKIEWQWTRFLEPPREICDGALAAITHWSPDSPTAPTERPDSPTPETPTPLTDAAIYEEDTGYNGFVKVVSPDFARTLELRLAAAEMLNQQQGELLLKDATDLLDLRIRIAAAEQARREAEERNEALKTLWTEMRVVLTQSRNANCLCSYGDAQVDAVEAANKILNTMPSDVASELTALRAEVERLKASDAFNWSIIKDCMAELEMTDMGASMICGEIQEWKLSHDRIKADREYLRAQLLAADGLAEALRNIIISSKWSGTPPETYRNIARAALAAYESARKGGGE